MKYPYLKDDNNENILEKINELEINEEEIINEENELINGK